MGLFEKLRLLRLGNKALGRLEEAKKMGKLQTSLFGLGAMVLAGIVHQFTAACPGWRAAASSMAVAGLMGAAAYWSTRPKESATAKAIVLGVSSAALAGVLRQLDSTCPGVVQELPSILTVGATTGLALWMRSPKEEKQG